MKYTIETTNTADLYLSFHKDAPIHTVFETGKARLTLEGRTLALSIGGRLQATAELPFNEAHISSERVALYLSLIFQERFSNSLCDQQILQSLTHTEEAEEAHSASYSLIWRIMQAMETLGLISIDQEDSEAERFRFTDRCKSIFSLNK